MFLTISDGKRHCITNTQLVVLLDEIYEPTNQILLLQIISKGEATRFEKLKNLP